MEEIEKQFALTYFAKYVTFNSDIGKAFELGYNTAWSNAIGAVMKNSDMMINGKTVFLDSDKLQKLIK